jgi:hypothetical protein
MSTQVPGGGTKLLLLSVHPSTHSFDLTTLLHCCVDRLPGVFFFYEVSPLHVEITETYRKGWVAFFTSVCAVIGGVVSVMGMVRGRMHPPGFFCRANKASVPLDGTSALRSSHSCVPCFQVDQFLFARKPTHGLAR